MNRDPLYRRIVEGLGQLTDGTLFQECVCDLLREDFPRLTPVPGGQDGGVDGSWADATGETILVATIKSDVIGNVTGNLKTRQAQGFPGEHVLVVTSQNLSARRVQNIRDRIEKLGFRVASMPIQEEGVAHRLYRSSKWLKELLGLSSAPCALSRLPKSALISSAALIERDDDLAWLIGTAGDRLLIGQPGMGKTRLCQELANRDRALFLVDSDIERLASAIRDNRPTAVVVEDAQVHLEELRSLIRLRATLQCNFDIIALGWPSSMDDLRGALELRSEQCRTLEPISAAGIVRMLKERGIAGPNWLHLDVVHQAVGCPGRADMLARVIRSGPGLKEVLDGSRLLSWARSRFGSETCEVLAVCAICGSHGATLPQVQSQLRLSTPDLNLHLDTLSGAGLLVVKPSGCVAVVPERLRHALVRHYFFERPNALQWPDLLEAAPSRTAALNAIIVATRDLPNAPRSQLHSLVSDARDHGTWESFLSVSRKNAELSVDRDPTLATTHPIPLLAHFPERSLPLLLEAAENDERALHSHPDHLLRRVEQWINEARGLSRVASDRRLALWVALKARILSGVVSRMSLRPLSIVVSPTWECHEQEASRPMSFRIGHGWLHTNDLERLAVLWGEIFETVSERASLWWEDLIRAADAWIYAARARAPLPDDRRAVFDGTVPKVLSGLTELAKGSPARLSDVAERFRDRGQPNPPEIDSDFSIMFPLDPHRAKVDFSEQCEIDAARARELAATWAAAGPAASVPKLLSCVEAQTRARHWPDLSEYVCDEIANRTESPCEWLCTLVASRAEARHLFAFAKAVACQGVDPSHPVVQLLENPVYEEVAAAQLLELELQSPEVETRLTQAVRRHPTIVAARLIREAVHPSRLRQLLEDDDKQLASTTAWGVWGQSQGKSVKVPHAIYQAWKHAILHDVDAGGAWDPVFEEYPEVAFAWLQREAQKDGDVFRVRLNGLRDRETLAAVEMLTREQRTELLSCLIPNAPRSHEIAGALVGVDPELYRFLLRDPEKAGIHWVPLNRESLDESWAALALVALDEGMPIDQIEALGSLRFEEGWGEDSERYEAARASWSSLLEHTDERIRRIATRGVEKCAEAVDRATKQEQQWRFWQLHG